MKKQHYVSEIRCHSDAAHICIGQHTEFYHFPILSIFMNIIELSHTHMNDKIDIRTSDLSTTVTQTSSRYHNYVNHFVNQTMNNMNPILQ
jgi:hypothetical protein